MTAGPMIDYETLAQEAMRGVVRTVLQRAAKSGLPGDHHFYISFDTEHLGVSLSKRLKEKYPAEMTIVLQHRFWDLIVSDERFEVKLTFDGIPERLVVPFSSIRVFFDPSVRYGLQFEDPEQADPEASGTTGGVLGDNRAPRQPRKPRAASAKKARPVGREPSLVEVGAAASNATSTVANPSAAQNANAGLSAVDTAPKPDNASQFSSIQSVDDKPANGSGAEIVSLDKFRKK
jgi:uncharacterized protein